MKNTNTTLSNKKKKIVLSILLGTASVVVAPIILMQCNNSKTDQPLSPSKLIINYAGNISISTSESVERIFTIEDDIGNKIEDAIFSSEAASDESVVSKPNITCISGNKYKFSLTGKKEGNATISFKAANDKLDGALSDIYINVKTNPSILCPILSNTQFTVAANKTTSFDFKVQDDKGNIVNDAEWGSSIDESDYKANINDISFIGSGMYRCTIIGLEKGVTEHSEDHYFTMKSKNGNLDESTQIHIEITVSPEEHDLTITNYAQSVNVEQNGGQAEISFNMIANNGYNIDPSNDTIELTGISYTPSGIVMINSQCTWDYVNSKWIATITSCDEATSGNSSVISFKVSLNYAIYCSDEISITANIVNTVNVSDIRANNNPSNDRTTSFTLDFGPGQTIEDLDESNFVINIFSGLANISITSAECVNSGNSYILHIDGWWYQNTQITINVVNVTGYDIVQFSNSITLGGHIFRSIVQGVGQIVSSEGITTNLTITFGEATTVIGLDIDSFTIIDEEGAGFNVNITSVEDTSGGYGQSYKLNIDGTWNASDKIKIIIEKDGYYITQYENPISLSGTVVPAAIQSIQTTTPPQTITTSLELNFNEGYEGITDLNVDDFKITFADGSETSIVISKVEDISVENNGYVYALSISGARNDNAEIKIIIQKAGYYITQYEGTISLSGAVYSSKVNSIISNSNLATSALTLSFDTNNGMRGIDGLDVDSFTITSVDGGEESNVKITGVNSEDLGNTYVLSVGGIWSNNHKIKIIVNDKAGYYITQCTDEITLSGTGVKVNSIVDNNINESVTVSLNLSFSSAIGGLTKENFEITNVSTGADVKICETQAINSGLSYTLTLSGIWSAGNVIKVSVVSASGYNITQCTDEITLGGTGIKVNSIVGNIAEVGGATTSLTLTLSSAFTSNLVAGSFIITNISDPTHVVTIADIDTEDGITYTLTLGGTWANGEEIAVSIDDVSGYNITQFTNKITLNGTGIKVNSIVGNVAEVGGATTSLTLTLSSAFTSNLVAGSFIITNISDPTHVVTIADIDTEDGITYTLTLGGTWANGEEITVSIDDVSGYNITQFTNEITLSGTGIKVNSVVGNIKEDTTVSLTLTLSSAFANDLTASNFTITNISDPTHVVEIDSTNFNIEDDGKTYTIGIIWYSDSLGEKITVSINNVSGYNITQCMNEITLQM